VIRGSAGHASHACPITGGTAHATTTTTSGGAVQGDDPPLLLTDPPRYLAVLGIAQKRRMLCLHFKGQPHIGECPNVEKSDVTLIAANPDRTTAKLRYLSACSFLTR